MLRGFVTGGAWGLIVGALGVTTASLLAPQPPGNAPPGEPLLEMAQVAAADVITDLPGADTASADPAVEPVASAGTAPDLPAPTAIAGSDAQIADTAPAPPPMVDTASLGIATPVTGGIPALSVAPAPDSPVLPNPQAAAPVTPTTEADLVLSTEPAPPPAPEPPAPPVMSLAPDADPIAVIPVMPEVDAPPLVVPEVPPQVVPEAVVPEVVPEAVVPEVVPEAVVPEVVPEAVMPEVVPEAVVPEAVVPGTAAEPSRVIDPAPVPQPSPLPEVPSEPESAPKPGVGPDLALPLAPELIPAPRVTSLVRDGAQTALPPARIVLQGDAASLPQVAGGVRVNRPESTADAPDLTTSETGIINPDPLPVAVVTDGPALARFAAEFSNPEDKPLISVILIDDGGIAGLAAMLADVPFAVTVALDPADPDAAARMQTYRDMGIEVLAIAHLPDGALPSDVEVTLESVFATLPDAVGLLDIGDGGVQSSAAVTGQTLARLGADGRGLVVMSAGLNPALRAATTAGVPAGEVARDLDGDGQDAGTIRRFLDNAAFQARQKSGIILLARLKPETISALILWGTENRAAQVALAPISATLGQ